MSADEFMDRLRALPQASLDVYNYTPQPVTKSLVLDRIRGAEVLAVTPEFLAFRKDGKLYAVAMPEGGN